MQLINYTSNYYYNGVKILTLDDIVLYYDRSRLLRQSIRLDKLISSSEGNLKLDYSTLCLNTYLNYVSSGELASPADRITYELMLFAVNFDIIHLIEKCAELIIIILKTKRSETFYNIIHTACNDDIYHLKCIIGWTLHHYTQDNYDTIDYSLIPANIITCTKSPRVIFELGRRMSQLSNPLRHAKLTVFLIKINVEIFMDIYEYQYLGKILEYLSDFDIIPKYEELFTAYSSYKNNVDGWISTLN